MTALGRGSLFAGVPPELPAELTTVLAGGEGARVERIVSRGHATAVGEWYEQDEAEWVLLVAGAARLELAGGESVALAPGDWIDLPAGLPHRVAWTAPDIDTTGSRSSVPCRPGAPPASGGAILAAAD